MHILIGLLLALLGGEAVFRLLPVSTATYTGYHLDPYIISYPPHHRFTTATGWDLQNAQEHRANNVGFLAQHDFFPNPDAIALIGDSYVEANMLPAKERLAARLEEKFGRSVYAFGGPGSNLLDYARRISYARQNFGIRDFIVALERHDMFQALCGSGNIHAYCVDPDSLALRIELQEKAGALKQLVRHSALAQYLFSQLKLKPAQLFRFDRPGAIAATGSAKKPHLSAVASAAIQQHFLNLLPVGSDVHLSFVLDANRSNLLDESAQHDPAWQAFSLTMQQRGATFIELAPVFRQNHTQHSLRISPQDNHWSPYAIQLIAEEIDARTTHAR